MAPGLTDRRRARFSAAEARRIALAASGFRDGRVERPTARHLARVVGRLGLLQIDSVNVLARAHYVPAFSRLGPYDPALLDRAAYGRRHRTLFEYWGHEASLIRIDLEPAFRWRMEEARAGRGIYGGLARFGAERRPFIDEVLREVETRGPLTAADLEGNRRPDELRGGWWGWTDAKRALEWLFWAGLLTTRTRRSFARIYDLPERVFPAEVIAQPTPEPAEAHRRLMAVAARALGIATEPDLRDYFRLDPASSKAAVAALVEAGDLLPAAVEGWSAPAYLDPAAAIPRRIEARALVSPFDPLVWERSRTERLFGFRYRLEIYTPAHKREHGYYVLPFLFGERLVARVDLKADRQAGRLLVQSVHLEPGAGDSAEILDALTAELGEMARWLGLGEVVASA
ncbi:winged helix-turn-helix domain-containing protein [uncultured Enterovirga sp.]|uniref:winged helix-turn-helix domain-containing protein n=1 Tax=uncultured Enterovirga sp. TaxID=2026352 RepID=UPI0035CB2318